MTLTLVLKKGFYPKEYISEIRKLYHLPFKSYDQCKNILRTNNRTDGRRDRQTDRQTDRKTDGSKTICPRSIDAGGGGKRKLKTALNIHHSTELLCGTHDLILTRTKVLHEITYNLTDRPIIYIS